MTDIVNRLKFWAENDLTAQNIAEEAADKIEHLRKENEKLREGISQLERRDAILSALEAGGVDNWEWYGEALNQAGLIDYD